MKWNDDDLKYSYVDPIVNDEFGEWCEETNVSEDLGHVKVVRREIHDFLNMIIYFTQEGSLKINVKYDIKGML